jgi:hypothetical protein
MLSRNSTILSVLYIILNPILQMWKLRQRMAESLSSNDRT